MKTIARIISAIFSPLLSPVYGMVIAVLTSVMSVLPSVLLWNSVIMTFVTTCILPALAIFAMYRLGYVSDPGLNNRTERTYPYIITLLCYLGCALFFHRANAPEWLCGFFLGGAAACVINIVVNRWWKISAHAAGMAGLVALTFRIATADLAVVNMNWWITGVIIATGLTMTARVYLGRHTLWQVVAGAVNGFVCVYFLSMLP